MSREYLRVAGFSPDRTAAFRLLASSLSVFSTLVLIQPTLTGLEPGRPPAPLPLDSASIAPSRTLLLDTFQQVVLCHGAHVAAWMKEKDGKENPELQKLLDDSRERAARGWAEPHRRTTRARAGTSCATCGARDASTSSFESSASSSRRKPPLLLAC